MTGLQLFLALTSVSVSGGFTLPPQVSIHTQRQDQQYSSRISSSLQAQVSPESSSSNFAQDGGGGTNLDLLRQRRDRLSQRLDDISSLQDSVTLAKNVSEIDQLERTLNVVEADVGRLSSGLIPPPGVSLDEYVKATTSFVKLPFRMRWALCISLGMEESVTAASKWDMAPIIVSRLYSERSSLTPARLQDALQVALSSELVPKKNEDGVLLEMNLKPTTGSTTKEQKSSKQPKGDTIQNIFGEEESPEEVKMRRADALLPGVTRKEGVSATVQELQTLLFFLNEVGFVVSTKEDINGGYVLRGTSRKPADELMPMIEDRLPAGFQCQVCFMEEFLEFEGQNEPTLVLLKKDMSPSTNELILATTTAVAVVTAFLFSYGVYGANEVVVSRISESSTNPNDIGGINWLNSKVLELLLPMAAIQMSHELGHFIVSKKDGIKTTFPTLLPCWGLPFLGTLTRIRESPKNFASLLDFALLGPLFGIVASLGLLLAGLEMGNMASPEVLQLFPALPVNVIKISTLGGTIVDLFQGGEGFVTSQDPSTAVPLHPFAIAGFVGLMMNSLELLPLGSTDGGRLCLSVFGRKGHAVLSGIVWIGLLAASLLLERADALIGAWVVYGVCQNDAEIPCRDEVTKIGAARIATAFALWFFAVLVVVPM